MKYKRRKKEINPNYNDEVEDKSEDMILVTKNVTIEGFYHVFFRSNDIHICKIPNCGQLTHYDTLHKDTTLNIIVC